jgi:hypothetical protein
MELSYSHRFIFIHIYRAAGQSVRAALRPYADVPRVYFPRVPGLRRLGDSRMRALREHNWGHIKAKELRAEIPPEIFDSFFKFSFVRNPWEWQVSAFHYVRQRPENAFHERLLAFRDFGEYLDWRIHEEGPDLQSEYVLEDTGELLVDFLGRYERLTDDFAEVCRRIGVECSLPHVNRSEHDNFRRYYTPATRDLVASAYREDIERFGYEFG